MKAKLIDRWLTSSVKNQGRISECWNLSNMLIQRKSHLKKWFWFKDFDLLKDLAYKMMTTITPSFKSFKAKMLPNG